MSRLQSIRLAQFWQMRLKPLFDRSEKGKRLSSGEVFESVGWLIEGVFCGFFDPRDGDIVWIRTLPLLEKCSAPAPPLVSPSRADQLARLREWNEPFRRSLQMPDGPQKGFELPLFSTALLLSNHFSADPLAKMCTSVIRTDNTKWHNWTDRWNLVDHATVADVLAETQEASRGTGISTGAFEPLLAILDLVRSLSRGETRSQAWGRFREFRSQSSVVKYQATPALDMARFAVGYIRVLEHMEASQSFFSYAKVHSPRRSDFESYCERIGGLNAWRIPLHRSEIRNRFAEQLPELFEVAISPTLKETGIPCSEFDTRYFKLVRSLMASWESHHCSASLEQTLV